MAKKRRQSETESEEEVEGKRSGHTSGEQKPKKKKNKEKKKKKKNSSKDDDNKEDEMPTVSIAVPGSIIHNAQSLELATRLAGHIARAATIFRIDEIVVFDSKNSLTDESSVVTVEESIDGEETGAPFLLRILKYLETPQYLRRSLFPIHSSLRCAGTLPPLDAPHHLRKHEWAPYREGITLKDRPSGSTGTLVDVGLAKNVLVDEILEPGIRVTVSMGTDRHLKTENLRKVVPSSVPREDGLYWGYKVRYASNISSVFKDCPYKGGYDHTIGTSEHGTIVRSSELSIPTFRHLLIAFGGLAGLEESIEEDSRFKGKEASKVFDSYLNICPNQGSRTIRTEEAILICLQYFQEPISRAIEQHEAGS